MYPPFALNGLKTKPGLPGTGFATGNCKAAVEEIGLVAVRFGVAPEDRSLDFLEATRGVGEGTGNGFPGLVTSDVFGAGVGSGERKT